MSHIEGALVEMLKDLPAKPGDDASREEKKAYSEIMSNRLAAAFAAELRERGLEGTRPAPPGLVDESGAERRIAGGIGAKKVDITWTTDVSGLLLGVSVKTINFRDRKSNNFQKNLMNRRGDLISEAMTLHRRFPYAVLVGFLFLDKDAAEDNTEKRRSTFENAHQRLRLSTGRQDPAGLDEQYEQFYVVLVDANPFSPRLTAYRVGEKDPLSFEYIFNDIVQEVAERNADFYEIDEEGKIRKTG
jgi:hypothetical protein